MCGYKIVICGKVDIRCGCNRGASCQKWIFCRPFWVTTHRQHWFSENQPKRHATYHVTDRSRKSGNLISSISNFNGKFLCQPIQIFLKRSLTVLSIQFHYNGIILMCILSKI